MLNITEEIAESDLRALAAMLGREPRGVCGIPARCEAGLPVVACVRPLLEDDSPFPTTFWLTCPELIKAVARLEDGSVIKELEREITQNKRLKDDLLMAQEEFGDIRRSLGEGEHELFDTGIGGVKDPTKVKCLHAHLALYLAGGRSPVGERIARLVEPVSCPKGCVR